MLEDLRLNIKTHIEEFNKDFFRFIKDIFLLFRINLFQVIIFVLYCAVFTIIFTFIFKQITLGTIMDIAGVTYISQENLKSILFNPRSIVIIIIFLIVVTFMALFEIAGLLHAFSMSQVGRKTNIYSMVAIGIRTCLHAANPENWLIVLFVMVLFPLTKFLPLSSSTFKLIVPEFVYQTINYTKLYYYLYRGAYMILLLVIVVYIFSINFFVLQKTSFINACAQSRKLGKGSYLKILFTITLFTLLLNIAINSFSSVVVINTQELLSLIHKNTGIVNRVSSNGSYTYLIRQIIKSVFSPAINNAAFTALFYHYIDEKHMMGSLSRNIFMEKQTPKLLVVAFRVFVVFVLLICGMFYFIFAAFLTEEDPISRPLVCAHRGDNVNAPENTMPAFQLAASENLEWIELDVHQTSDGVIICNHDSDLARVTGTKISIHDNTYKELLRYKMGDWMPGNYENVTVPRLKDVLMMAKRNNMNVQVELKGHPDDINFEENVLKVINETGMHNNVMIISLDANRVRRINELDPSITKAYCMMVAIGDLNDIDFTDNVSIEEKNVNPLLVYSLHAKGKKVFCWTVDNQDTLQYLVSCNVDVIGTDNPNLINSGLDNVDYSNGPIRIFYVLMNLLSNMGK